MDEKAKPRVAAGLGKGGPSRWHCLEPEGVTDADAIRHTLWSAL
jgi:hypothetical protein